MVDSRFSKKDGGGIRVSGSASATMQPSSDSANPYAAGWRMWVPVVVMMSCPCLSYIDRQALTVISPLTLKNTGLSATE